MKALQTVLPADYQLHPMQTYNKEHALSDIELSVPYNRTFVEISGRKDKVNMQ
jgi:hypothetical protein